MSGAINANSKAQEIKSHFLIQETASLLYNKINCF